MSRPARIESETYTLRTRRESIHGGSLRPSMAADGPECVGFTSAAECDFALTYAVRSVKESSS